MIDHVKSSSLQVGCASKVRWTVTVEPAATNGTSTFKGFSESTVAPDDTTAETLPIQSGSALPSMTRPFTGAGPSLCTVIE